SVCPTGALTPKSDVDEVWKVLDDPDVRVVVQTAPAVRVGLGEYFGMPAGSVTTGSMVAALKALGFDRVFDTSFTADMTVLEESEEFLARFRNGERLPQFTSCCPSWVKFAEQYYPECLPNLSSCKSPQQMFGSLARNILPAELGISPERLVVVSVMPCTAKKFEARQDKFSRDGRPDVDYVITTQELGRMIEQATIDFFSLEPESFDMPMGFKTGAGVLFGVSGGVTEAVLRYAVEKLQGKPLDYVDFTEVRGEEGIREATIEVDGVTLRLAVVQGLANVKKIAESIKNGSCSYHLIEVMACPGGCVSGAGQPVSPNSSVRRARTRAIYHDDKAMQIHKAQENPALQKCYATHLGHVGSHTAHELLHTRYQNRRRMADENLYLIQGKAAAKVAVRVCVGTSCFLKGSQQILKDLMAYAESDGLQDRIDLAATFCFERCGESPNVRVGETLLSGCTFEKVRDALLSQLEPSPVAREAQNGNKHP
ncbi:MAG TPA: [FeFe] hydrogenase, group A, partial [Acidobacteriota bacterium]|nr:[FeFe] hydrogenase, group A [Acidobacteriota bacterium]